MNCRIKEVGERVNLKKQSVNKSHLKIYYLAIKLKIKLIGRIEYI